MGAVLLIVDDEEPIRRLLETLLSTDYTLFAAKDGLEAYNIFRQLGGAVDLVLTDLFMPGMNGSELAEKLRNERPDLPILFMSGFVDEAPRTECFIRKPFTKPRLKAAVRRSLSGIPGCGENREPRESPC